MDFSSTIRIAASKNYKDRHVYVYTSKKIIDPQKNFIVKIRASGMYYA